MVRDQMQEILLVEIDSELDRSRSARARFERPAADGGHPGWSARLAAGRWTPVVVILVMLLVVVWAVAGYRERDRAARLAAEPGLLAALRPSLTEVWRSPVRGWGRFAAVGGDVLLFGTGARDPAAVDSLAGRTGQALWRAPLPELEPGGDVSCLFLGDSTGQEGAAQIACRLVLGSAGTRRADVNRGRAQVRILVLDARTGARLADRPLAGTNVSLTALGGDVLVSERLFGGFARVTRQDAVTGDVRWTYRSAERARGWGGTLGFLDTRVQHGVVLVQGAIAVALSLDGEVLGEWGRRGDEWGARGGWGVEVSVLPDGRFVVGQPDGAWLTDADYGKVLASPGLAGFAVKGPVLEPVVDDGSAADVVFTVPRGRGGMAAQDARTGALLWSTGNVQRGEAIVLDRRLVGVVGRELVALDARSGEPLWNVPIPRGNRGQQVFTDGRVVVVPAVDSERAPILRAFDPADGREQWTVPLPGGGTHLAALDGRLVQLTDRELIVLG